MKERKDEIPYMIVVFFATLLFTSAGWVRVQSLNATAVLWRFPPPISTLLDKNYHEIEDKAIMKTSQISFLQ